MALSFASCATRAVLMRVTVPEDHIEAYLNAFTLPAIFDTLSFCAFTYHNVYRSMLLVWPDRPQIPWMIAGLLTFSELCLHIPPLVIVRANLLKYLRLIQDPLTQQLTLALAVYVSAIDSIFFVVTQSRIISVMQKVQKARTPRSHYGDALLRGVCFSGAIFLFFTSLDGAFFDPNEGLTFMSAAPAIIYIILLTDSERIRKLVLALQRGPVQRGQVDERLSGGAELQPRDTWSRGDRSTLSHSR
ncbi:hypothetical protein DFJ73DRAFT_869163 [Zopfochytrium polystomum]|nr:hypothetical protein DFJ73DRAFT_869163 [Zopfochytrium polystomum]